MTGSLPRFAVDRCLAKRVPAGLAQLGWRLVSIYDVLRDFSLCCFGGVFTA